MRVTSDMLDLTNKFLNDFFALCSSENNNKQDDLYYFNFTLADAISQSNYPRYEESEGTLLMGMSSFDDSIAKAFMNNRCQGFIKQIVRRIENTENQEDYLITDIKTSEYLKDDYDFDITFNNDKSDVIMRPCKVKCIEVSFNVSNNRSGFNGYVVIDEEWGKEFSDSNNFVEKFIIKRVKFYSNNIMVMNIDYVFNHDTFTYYEKVEFSHYKHIADINSFYNILSCNLF